MTAHAVLLSGINVGGKNRVPMADLRACLVRLGSDVARVGGGYRLTFDTGTAEPMAFFGRYLEVTPPMRLVWTNLEGDEGTVVTTVTFEDHGAATRLVGRDRYPSKEALDAAIESGATSWNPETFDQLDELLVKLVASTQAVGSETSPT
jgi:uncharacterized protein YndB with AHSA1/START domain